MINDHMENCFRYHEMMEGKQIIRKLRDCLEKIVE